MLFSVRRARILHKIPNLLVLASYREQGHASLFFYRPIANHTHPLQDSWSPMKMSQAPSPSVHQFDPKLPLVIVQGSDGGTAASYNVYLTPKAKPAKLLPALEGLLNQAYSGAGRSESDNWILDERGDAIHRHLAFHNEGDVDAFLSQLKAVADEINHHPHVTGEAIMTVTCTTHNPRGLSMRDVRLATKIEELAAKFALGKLPAGSSDGSTSAARIQQDQRLINRAAIDRVLSEGSGACFGAENRSG